MRGFAAAVVGVEFVAGPSSDGLGSSPAHRRATGTASSLSWTPEDAYAVPISHRYDGERLLLRTSDDEGAEKRTFVEFTATYSGRCTAGYCTCSDMSCGSDGRSGTADGRSVGQVGS